MRPRAQTSGPVEVTSWVEEGFGGVSYEIHTASQTPTHTLHPREVLHANKGQRFLTNSPLPGDVITTVIHTRRKSTGDSAGV